MTKLERTLGQLLESWRTLGARSRMLPQLLAQPGPLDLRIVGRVLLHAALIGLAAGFVGSLFFVGLEYLQRLLLQGLAGYTPLRAEGERIVGHTEASTFRPWLLALLPAAGGLLCGLITKLAPETQGGGGNAMIDAFHYQGGVIRRRVIGVKLLASLASLGTGGAGGREGPTMQIGGAIGSLVGRVLGASTRERRILLVAGVAAGISAVFRTPLGAALLAVEVLYQDGFESDALVPSVLASVVAYSVVISVFGENTLFASTPRMPFVPTHLPLFGLLAVFIAALAALFVAAMRLTRRGFNLLPVPLWVKPGIGGLLLGLLAVPIIVFSGHASGLEGQGLGILGGGYGAVQVAITGATWLPNGWTAVQLLALLSLAKIVASSLTIESGGSAGDFAPSLVIGGLFGGAFGRAAELLLGDPRIQPGAFALVGMGVFYGGVAHVPLSAIVLVCELAGNYDLLVPLMLAMGIAFVALRKVTLYESQARSIQHSPVHQRGHGLEALALEPVSAHVDRARQFLSFAPSALASALLARLDEAEIAGQDVFPVVDPNRRLVGVITATALLVVARDQRDMAWALAADIMQPPVSVSLADNLRRAAELMLANALRELPVIDEDGQVCGMLDESEVARAFVAAPAFEASDPDRSSSSSAFVR